MTHDEGEKKIAKIIAKAWADEGFKNRLLSDQAKVFEEEGLEIAPGVEVRIVEDTDKVRHLLLPMKPVGMELSDEQLLQVSGGGGTTKCGGTPTSKNCTPPPNSSCTAG